MIYRKAFTYFVSLLILLMFNLSAGWAQLALEPFASDFIKPVSMASSGDSRLFVVEQSGIIKILDSTGVEYNEPFLYIEDQVLSGGEQGLLGLAFHPDYAENGFFYVNYTANGPATIISRFTVSQTDPNRADPGSELVILSFDQPYENHNGGDIQFGPDNYLYIATGDGGSGGDPQNDAQDLTSLLGKLLRIDINGLAPYSIPEDNPFFGVDSVASEIWAYGLRNPWRFSFDSETGDLWIADVGQNKYEEVNFQPASSKGGENYGWRCYEAMHEYNFSKCPDQTYYVFPIIEIDQEISNACSVTGGYVYRGSKFPALTGKYIFTDYCSSQFWSIQDSSGTWILNDYGIYSVKWISCFGEDHQGELYVAELNSGKIFRITDSGNAPADSKPGQPLFSLYPNPAGELLIVETSNGNQEFQKVRIIDLQGRECFKATASGTYLEVPLYHLSPGIYFIEATVSGNRAIQKFTRQ